MELVMMCASLGCVMGERKADGRWIMDTWLIRAKNLQPRTSFDTFSKADTGLRCTEEEGEEGEIWEVEVGEEKREELDKKKEKQNEKEMEK